MNKQLLLGTRKGLFIAERGSSGWDVSGPHCDAWPVLHAAYDPARDRITAASGNPWYGPMVWHSDDRGETWQHSSEGIRYPEGESGITTAWALHVAEDGTYYLGVDPAGLFRSNDGGHCWEHVAALREHESYENWMAGGGGLILHSIVSRGDELLVGISAAGLFRSPDRGKTWEHSNGGIPDPGPGGAICPHHIPPITDGERLYQQNHDGMWRSDDGGRNWVDITEGLPSRFGFAAAAHPADRDIAYAAPLNGDTLGRFMPEGKPAVWRTRNAGETWERLDRGLPSEGYFGVYRLAMCTDPWEPSSLYFGTSNGQVYASANEGDSWTEVAQYLPPVLSVTAVGTPG